MNAEMIEMCEEPATFFIMIGVELFFFFFCIMMALGLLKVTYCTSCDMEKWTASAGTIQLSGHSRQ